MFFLYRPSDTTLHQTIQSQVDQPFTYIEVGASQGQLPSGYVIDHNRVLLGHGADTYRAAKQAFLTGRMLTLDWLEPDWPTTIAEDQMVSTLAHVLGIWVLNVCRVVYVIDEDREMVRFGFAYGTLPEHAEQGEERFLLEWNRQDDRVWYDILAFSRPHHILSLLGYPYVRSLQKRFGRDSLQAMRQSIAE